MKLQAFNHFGGVQGKLEKKKKDSYGLNACVLQKINMLSPNSQRIAFGGGALEDQVMMVEPP